MVHDDVILTADVMSESGAGSAEHCSRAKALFVLCVALGRVWALPHNVLKKVIMTSFPRMSHCVSLLPLHVSAFEEDMGVEHDTEDGVAFSDIPWWRGRMEAWQEMLASSLGPSSIVVTC